MLRRMLWLVGAVVVLVVLSSASPAWSQPDTGGPKSVSNGLKYFDFFVVKGGWIAWLIILLSVVAGALTLEHCMTIRRGTIVPPQAVDEARSLIEQQKYVEAVQFAAEEPSMLGCAIAAALREAPNGFVAMERALDESLEERSAKLFRKIEYLNIIGAVSPMLGLFGTVVGMILLFAEIHASDAFPRAQIVADNVAVALVTTFWGLAVAIPSLSVYAVFRNRIDVLTSECALAVDQMLAVFKPGGASTTETLGAVANLPRTVGRGSHATAT